MLARSPPTLSHTNSITHTHRSLRLMVQQINRLRDLKKQVARRVSRQPYIRQSRHVGRLHPHPLAMLLFANGTFAQNTYSNNIHTFIFFFFLPLLYVQLGSPKLVSNASQLILKYLLMNKNLVSKTWRNRIYYYSSGTVFAIVSNDLGNWLDEEEGEQQDLRSKYLRQVRHICP